MATSNTDVEMEEQEKRTEGLGTTPPLSPQLQNREESGLPNCSLELTADMDTSSPLEELKTMIDRTFRGTDSPASDSSRSGSVKSLEMGESTSSPERSRNLALVASILEKLTIEEKRNFILAVLKDVPMAQQPEMLSQLAKNKDVDRQTLPLFSSRAIHFESAEMEVEPGRSRTWCPACRPTPYPSRLLGNQFSNAGVQDVEALSSAQPLETLYAISEDSVYEDTKDTVVGILELPMAADQPESEQRARALVNAVHQPINNAMSKYIGQQKAGEPASLREATDKEVIGSGYLVQISGRVTAAIMADLATCSCSKPFHNLYSSMAATMRKLSERLKSKAECKDDPEDVLPTPSTLPPSVVPAESASLKGSFNYSLGENIAAFSKEDLTKVTRAASEILGSASRCISTELLPTPDDMDEEVLEIVQTVASDMQRLYDSTEGSSFLKELVTTAPGDGTEKFSMVSRLALHSALAGIFKNVHGKIKSLFSKSAMLETDESDMTPAQKASSETRPVSSSSISPEAFQTRSSSPAASCSSISPEAFQTRSSSPAASCSSPHVPANLEVDESKENAAEVKKYKDAEAELSGLMERMLFIGEDPASVEIKLDILLCTDALRPLTDELAKQIHAFMQASSHARAPAARRWASDTAVLGAKTTGENRRAVISQVGFKDLVYIFTESKIRALLENLVVLMFPTPDAVEIIQCSHSTGRLPVGKGGCRNRLSCIFQEITGLFTRKTAKKVSDTMFQTSCCLPLNRTEQVMTQAPSHSDRNLHSVVNRLVARNMAKIGAKVDSQEVSRRVSAQVLSLVCIASGLKEDQVYPEDIDLDDVYKTVKTALRTQFISKEGLRTAVANNDPIFERSLVCFLSYALVMPVKEREGNDTPQKKPSLLKRLLKKKAKREKPCQTFSNKNNTISPAEENTMPSVATSPEESPATEQKPQKKSVWIRFFSAIVKTFT